MKLPEYPKYKPSGVEWLGEVPEEWDRCRFSREVMIAEGQVDPEKAPFASMILIGPEHVESRTGRLLETSSAAEQTAESGKYFCHKGNVVYSKIRPALRKVTLAPEDCLCSADMYPLQPGRRFRSKYLFWLLLSEGFSAWSVLEADRVAMPKINRDTLNSLQMPVPSLSEQDAVTDFLDRETGKIDTLVAKKRTLVERLKEKRTALISRTVTRGLPPDAARAAGLDPHPKLKPSGIDWLGDIPAHWEVVRIGKRIVLQRGVDITKDEQNEGAVPVVSSGGIASFHDRFLARGPGVVVGRKGTAGAVYYIEEDFWPHDTTLWVKEFFGNHPRYVYYKLLSMDLASFDTGSANPTVNRNLVHPVLVSWPPKAEQRFIADFLDREIAKMDRMIAVVESATDRLSEYRTALITAAVTGKIDVRGVRS